MSKFNTLFEEQIGQFTKPGPVAGDYIKIKSNYKQSDWWKGLDEARQNYVGEIMALVEQGKLLMLSTIKKGMYETRHANQAPSSDASNWDTADITVEYNPGFYSHSLTVPVELLEFDMTWEEARGTHKMKGQEDNSTLKPEEAKTQNIDVGQQTNVPGGDYKLGTANYMP